VPLRNQKLVVYVLIFILALLLLFSRSGSFNPLEFQVVETASLPIRIIMVPINEVKKIIYHRIFNEYVKIRAENNMLKRRLVAMDELALENSRLEQLLGFKRRALFSSIPANVIFRDASNWNSSMVIDKGAADGLSVGMPVVNALGVVGKIAEVGKNKSKVILLTDPSFSAAAMVQRSREIGLISGSLRGMCRLRYLSDNADVQIGDLVVTSKMSSSFPEGLVIGQVVEVYPGGALPQPECVIRPAVALSQLEEVLVVKMIE